MWRGGATPCTESCCRLRSLFFGHVGGHATPFEFGHRSLEGLEGVHAGTFDLTAEISVDIAARLREAGIRVFTAEERTPDTAVLEVVAVGKGRYSVEYEGHATQLRLLQPVTLSRDPSIAVPAVTWQDMQIVLGAGESAWEEERKNTETSVDRFIDAYLKANPLVSPFQMLRREIAME